MSKGSPIFILAALAASIVRNLSYSDSWIYQWIVDLSHIIIIVIIINIIYFHRLKVNVNKKNGKE